jgi:hypothetical protein
MKGSKVKSSSSTPMIKGGGKGMFGKMGAAAQPEGTTGRPTGGAGKFKGGGKGKMFGKQTASAAPAGRTGK